MTGGNLVLQIKEKALQIVRTRGPILPVQLTKELGINVLMASAILSELVDTKVLKLTYLKIGSSPMYYVVGQEPKLQMFRDKLNDKQQIAFDMLSRNKVLQDREVEPVIRLSLRDMKDFALPLQVTSGSFSEIFWKWYLISDSEAEPIIKEKLNKIQKTMPKEPIKEREIQNEISKVEEELKKIEEKQKPIEQKVKEDLKAKEIARETKEELMGAETLKEKPKRGRKPKQETILPQTTEAPASQIDESDEFMTKVLTFFKENGIQHSEIKQIKKESDFEGLVRIPTAVGHVNYFCKAKNKQKISDADLSMLYVQSQMKKLPILLVTTGEVTKKAQEMLNKEFKNITIKKI